MDPNTRRYAHCLPLGAQLVGAGSDEPHTRFRLWAPSCESVQLQLEGGCNGSGDAALVDMQRAGNGWFEAETACGAGTLYRYRINGELAIPDPASRFQPQDVHGPSEVIDPRAYHWQHAHWQGRPWEETVLYELHVGTLGGYAGVTKRLAALAEVGVTAIELMPLNEFPGERNWGYDGVLPYAPDSAYGRPEDLKALIDAAHGLGLMVFLDVVYNHFGPDGNYLQQYAKPFFKDGSHTPWGQAIDFDRMEVRDFFCENALYWLNEYRFDGLRIDAVHAIDNDGWLRELADHVHARVEPGRHVHLVLENERNHASLLESHFNAQWNDDAHNVLHVMLTGETEGYYQSYAEAPARKLARVLGEGFAYQGDPSPAHDGAPRGGAAGAAAEAAELDLHDVDERHHQEPAPAHGAHRRRQDPDAERHPVDHGRAADGGSAAAAAPEAVVRVGAHDLLEAERDDAGEEEAGEGEDVEQDEVGLDAVPRGAGGAQAVGAAGELGPVGGGAPRQADEGRQGEERVHVHDAVQRRDVDARAPAATAAAAG
jgi:maltooligosyltrehalose trehalohydrolase